MPYGILSIGIPSNLFDSLFSVYEASHDDSNFPATTWQIDVTCEFKGYVTPLFNFNNSVSGRICVYLIRNKFAILNWGIQKFFE